MSSSVGVPATSDEIAADANGAGAHTHNSGWSESDITDWCRAELQKSLQNQILFTFEDIVCRTTQLNVFGEGSVTSNKGKTAVVIELAAVISWIGEASGRKVEGKLSLPNINEDNIESTQIEIVINEATSDEVTSRILAAMQIKGRTRVQDLLLKFWTAIRKKYGEDSLHVGIKDDAAKKKDLCRRLVTWMTTNMLTHMRTSWMSNKALAARTVITGIMTGSGSVLLGGPIGLAVAGALIGGGYGGYKGYKFQRENFAEFAQAFLETDRVLLVEMMGRFLDNDGGKTLMMKIGKDGC